MEKPLVRIDTCLPHGSGTSFAKQQDKAVSCSQLLPICSYVTVLSAGDPHLTQSFCRAQQHPVNRRKGAQSWQWPVSLRTARACVSCELPSVVGRLVCCNEQSFSTQLRDVFQLPCGKVTNSSSHVAQNISTPGTKFNWWSLHFVSLWHNSPLTSVNYLVVPVHQNVWITDEMKSYFLGLSLCVSSTAKSSIQYD